MKKASIALACLMLFTFSSFAQSDKEEQTSDEAATKILQDAVKTVDTGDAASDDEATKILNDAIKTVNTGEKIEVQEEQINISVKPYSDDSNKKEYTPTDYSKIPASLPPTPTKETGSASGNGKALTSGSAK